MRRSTKHRLKQRALYLGVVALCAVLAVWLATWGEAVDTRRYMAAPAPSGVELVTNNTGNAWTTEEESATIVSFDMGACTPNCYLVVSLWVHINITTGGCTFGATPIDQTVIEERQNNAGMYMYGVEGVSGINTITCTWTTPRRGAISARSFRNVNQTTPVTEATFNKSNSATSSSVTVNGTPADSLVVDSIMRDRVDSVLNADVGQTVDINAENSTFFGYASSHKTGGGNITTGYNWATLNAVSQVVFVLNPN